jgi:hypothetical protein
MKPGKILTFLDKLLSDTDLSDSQSSRMKNADQRSVRERKKGEKDRLNF